MLDLGRSLLACVERAPEALALVDDDMRLSYCQLYRRSSALVAGFREAGLKRGDRLLSVLLNNNAAASLHWACQLSGVTIVPVNWRSSSDEISFFLENSEAKMLVFDESSQDAVSGSARANLIPRMAYGGETYGAIDFDEVANASAPDAAADAGPEDWSIMLYTSGTTAKPKGVPRRHRAERAAAIAHVAQNLMPRGDKTLGVMPLYHTMGVRSLLSMALLDGTFVCLSRFNPGNALRLIRSERIASLYLVPTLYHDLMAHDAFSTTDLSHVKRLGFAGASMTDGLLQRIDAAFRPELFVNHYGSSEIYTFSVEQNAVAKPGSAGKPGLNQHLRVVEIGSRNPDTIVAPGEEGEIIATLEGDEAFEGYWRRPDADEKSLIDGWYFTGDSGHVDSDGDLFVTGRVDDMIITGGENVTPVEVESCLSLHGAVEDCAVVGLPDERWGKVVTAFVKRRDSVTAEELDQFCRDSDLANFKRPRRFIFVADLPKSPVGKLLRRHLVAGEYQPETELSEKTPR